MYSKIGERGEEQGARIKKLKIIDFLAFLGILMGPWVLYTPSVHHNVVWSSRNITKKTVSVLDGRFNSY